MKVALVRMTEEAYAEFWQMSFAHHAAELISKEGLTRAEAEKTAREELGQMLPQGLDTPENFLFRIVAGEQSVGYLWFLTEEQAGQKQLFLCDFLIYEADRKRGYGRAALMEMERIAAGLLCRACVLFAEAENEPAIRLYRRCGYRVLREHSYGFYMKKAIGADTNYPIEALAVLLDPGCLSARYAPLIAHRERLIAALRELGCRTKEDAARLSEDAYAGMGLEDAGERALLRRFFALYDPKPQKFREIEKIGSDPEEQAAFRELYCLPGVKAVRARLYFRAGYRTVRDFADAAPEDVIARTARVISEDRLTCTVPLPKEVRTQIAVAKAFTWPDGGEEI